MAIYRAQDGEVLYNGARIAKIRSVSLSLQRDAVDTTAIGDQGKTFQLTTFSASGSGEVLYDALDGTTQRLFQSVIDGDNLLVTLRISLNKTQGKFVEFEAWITSLQIGLQTGEVITGSVSFQGNGTASGTF